MRVLIGVDGSSNSFAAVEFVGRLLSAERDELVLLFATPAISFDDERLDPTIEDRARAALSRAVLEAALERLSPEWKEKAQQRELSGAEGTALLDAIEPEKPANQSPGPLTKHMHVLATIDDPAAAHRVVDLLKQLTWPPETRGWV